MRPTSTSAPIGKILSVLSVATLLATTGCDQLNKPMGHTSSSSSGAPTLDAGPEETDGAAPAPAITAQPGDVQL